MIYQIALRCVVLEWHPSTEVRGFEPSCCARAARGPAAAAPRSVVKRAASFDHLVGASEHRWWNFEAERPGRLEVDYQLVLGRRLYRQVRRLLALEDAVDVAGCAPVLINHIRPVGDQAAVGDEGAITVDRGQSVPGREPDDQITMARRLGARSHDRAAIRGTRKRGDGALELADVAYVDRTHFHPERRRRGLNGAKLPNAGGYGGIPEDGHSFDPRRNLLEHLQPFPALAIFEHEEAGGIAARARQARNETGADRINDNHKHDRDGAGRL